MTALTTKSFPTPVYWRYRCNECNHAGAVWESAEVTCDNCHRKLKFLVHNEASSHMTLDELRYEFKIVEVCEDIHMAIMGSADPLTEKQMKFLEDWLKYRLENWSEHSRIYDDCIRLLIKATLAELFTAPEWATYGDNK